MGQNKVFVVAKKHLTPLLRGEARVRNLPGDSDVVEVKAHGDELSYTVYSATFPQADQRKPLPRVRAVVERR